MRKILTGVVVATVVSMVAGPAGALTLEEVLQQIQQLQQQLAQLQQLAAQLQGQQGGQTGGQLPAACAGVSSFDRSLRQGMRGEDVRCLQALLNRDPRTQVASQGPGSPGNETSYFGPLTRAAVIRFQELYRDEILAPWGLTRGTGFVGRTTRAKLNEILQSLRQGTGPITQQAGLTVEISPASPAAGTVIKGQANAELARFRFSNGDSSEVKVTRVRFKRVGVSTDAVLGNVYLYQGNRRLAGPAVVSAGYITFADPNGVFTVPAGGSVEISVRADISSSASAGETVGVHIHEASDVETTASQVNGQFPVAGNVMTVASATLASVAVSGVSAPSTHQAGATDRTVWRATVTVNNNDVRMIYFALTQIGSIAPSDLQNFELYVNGQKVAGPVQMSNDYRVEFDLSSSPVTLRNGSSATVEVRADIIGGTGRQFTFSLQSSADLRVVDTQYGVEVPVSSGVPATTGTQQVSTGYLVVQVASDSPSGYVANGATNVPVARYTLTAYGERVRVNSLTLDVDTNPNAGLYNVRVFVGGSQVGSAQHIQEGTPVTFNLGSALIVEPGSPVTVEVRADIKKHDASAFANGNTIQVILKAGSNNAQTLTSLTILSVPGSDISARQVTVQDAGLTVVRSTSLADSGVVPGSQNVKIGEYVVSAVGEDVTLTSVVVNFAEVAGGTNWDDGSDPFDHISNVYVKYGDQQTTPQAFAYAGGNNFSVSATVPAGSTLTIEVYADIASSAVTGRDFRTRLTVYGTSVQTGTSLSDGPVDGQVMTARQGSLSVALSGTSPSAGLVLGGTTATVAAYDFTAQVEPFEVTQVTIGLGAADYETASQIILEYPTQNGSTATVQAPVVGTSNVISLSPPMYVPAGQKATLTVKVVVNNIMASSADTASSSSVRGESGDNLKVTLSSYRYRSATQPETSASPGLAGTDQRARKALVSLEWVTPASLSGGVVAKIKVKAQGGDVKWSKMVLTLDGEVLIGSTYYSLGLESGDTCSGAGGDDVCYNDNSGAASTVNPVLENLVFRREGATTPIAAGGSGLTVTHTANNVQVAINLTSDETIPANGSVTYELVAGTVSGSVDWVQPSIGQGSTFQIGDKSAAWVSSATFVWSDLSSEDTPAKDYANEVYVPGAGTTGPKVQ